MSPAGSARAPRRRCAAAATEWLDAGVFDGLIDEALGGYDRIIGLDLSDVAVDGPSTKHPSVAKAPARTPLTGANAAGSGRSPPTATASRSAGRSPVPTATTACCSAPDTRRRRRSRPARRHRHVASRPRLRQRRRAPPRRRLRYRRPASVAKRRPAGTGKVRLERSVGDALAGRAHQLAGCRTSVSSAATPTGSSTNASPNSPSCVRRCGRPALRIRTCDRPDSHPELKPPRSAARALDRVAGLAVLTLLERTITSDLVASTSGPSARRRRASCAPPAWARRA